MVPPRYPDTIRYTEDEKGGLMVDLAGICLRCLLRYPVLADSVATGRVTDVARLQRLIAERDARTGVSSVGCAYASGVVSVFDLGPEPAIPNGELAAEQ